MRKVCCVSGVHNDANTVKANRRRFQSDDEIRSLVIQIQQCGFHMDESEEIAIPRLREALKQHPDVWTRRGIAFLFGRLERKGLIPDLIRALKGDPEPMVRVAAAIACSNGYMRHYATEAIIPLVEMGLGKTSKDHDIDNTVLESAATIIRAFVNSRKAEAEAE